MFTNNLTGKPSGKRWRNMAFVCFMCHLRKITLLSQNFKFRSDVFLCRYIQSLLWRLSFSERLSQMLHAFHDLFPLNFELTFCVYQNISVSLFAKHKNIHFFSLCISNQISFRHKLKMCIKRLDGNLLSVSVFEKWQTQVRKHT